MRHAGRGAQRGDRGRPRVKRHARSSTRAAIRERICATGRGECGTALGAALAAWHNFYGETRAIPFETLCLGPAYTPHQIKQVLENCKLRFHFLNTNGELIREAIRALSDNKIVAWMQGRMEFGPRALGNRSILASPLNPY